MYLIICIPGRGKENGGLASNNTAQDEGNGDDECRGKKQRNNKYKEIRELNPNRKTILAKVRVTHVHGPLKLQAGVGQQM